MRANETRAFNPGLARHRGTWQRKSGEVQRNSFGEPIETWLDIAIVNAQVVSLQGREMETAQQRWAEASYKIRHQMVRGLRPSDRFAWLQVDGTVRYLDALDIQDQGGVGQVAVIYAKEWKA